MKLYKYLYQWVCGSCAKTSSYRDNANPKGLIVECNNCGWYKLIK
jgi:hypothetical protein